MARWRKDPPRWFVPALFGGMFIAVAALAGIGALFYDPPDHSLRIGERTYVIPPEHISSLTLDPHLFIRIRRPDTPFEIVHDSRLAGRHKETGVPRIFSIDDQGQHDVWYARDRRSLVVCRRASAPAGGCGTWIDYGGVKWSILFPESRIGDADQFVRRGTAILSRYDTRPSPLAP